LGRIASDSWSGRFDVQRPEDQLVVPGKPQGQVDVKVGASVVGVSRRHICQRASEAVCDQDNDLDRDNGDEYECKRDLAKARCNWNRE
jgi:hypothetical protein